MFEKVRKGLVALFFLFVCGYEVSSEASFGFYSLVPNRHQIPPHPVGPTPIPPPPIPGGVPVEAGFVSFVVQNLTGQPDDQVYVLTHGSDSSGDAAYLDIDPSTGKGSIVVAADGVESQSYCVLYSDLPALDANSRYFQIPQPFTAARTYFSIAHPLILAIGKDSITGKTTIDNPTFSSANDPNNYTLYDKIEFTYQPPPASGIDINLWIDATAADFFTLPITVRVASPVPSGQVPMGGLNYKRSAVNAHIQEIFDRFDLTPGRIWSNLFRNFLADPADPNSEIISTLRVQSPAKSAQFPLNYLDNAQTYGFSYVEDLWSFYSRPGNELRINAIEIAPKYGPGPAEPDYYKLTGRVVDANTMQFVNDTGDFTWHLQKPVGNNSTQPFFGGANFVDDGEANNTLGAIIVRQISSAFSVGILPRAFSGEHFMDAAFFASQMANYYVNNAQWGLAGSEHGPFYNLYSKSIQSIGNPIYTYTFDDELNQSGTITGNTEIPQGSFPVLTLYTIDNPIPDPFDDPTSDYSVTFTSAANNPVSYRQGAAGPFTPVTNGQTVSSITSNDTDVFQIELKNPNTQAVETLTIYLKYGIVLPGSTDFSAMLGTIIAKTGGKAFSVTTPGLP